MLFLLFFFHCISTANCCVPFQNSQISVISTKSTPIYQIAELNRVVQIVFHMVHSLNELYAWFHAQLLFLTSTTLEPRPLIPNSLNMDAVKQYHYSKQVTQPHQTLRDLMWLFATVGGFPPRVLASRSLWTSSNAIMLQVCHKKQNLNCEVRIHQHFVLSLCYAFPKRGRIGQ